MRARPATRALGVIIFLWLGSGSARALKPVRGYPAIPSDYGILSQDLTFRTADSLHIKGWFFPIQDTAGIANDLVGRRIPVPPELKRPPRDYRASGERPERTIIICGGDAGNMSYQIFYAYQFFTRGFNVLTFDWRGFGESDDWPMDPDLLSCTEFLLDYDSAIEGIKSHPGVDSTRIGVLGFSTGAYLSFAEVARRRDIAAYAGRALLTSFEDVLTLLRELDPSRKFHPPADFPVSLLPVNAAERVTIPVLLVVGERDNRTPPWMSERVFEKLKGPKELWIVPEAEHGGASGPEVKNYPEFFVRVAAFFDQHLRPRE